MSLRPYTIHRSAESVVARPRTVFGNASAAEGIRLQALIFLMAPQRQIPLDSPGDEANSFAGL
jgi:hypothetical protein